jgi:hypothetical protein
MATQSSWQVKLNYYLSGALQTGNLVPLEAFLNMYELDTPQREIVIGTFASTIGRLVTSTNPPVEQLETLLDRWAALTGDEHVILPILAVASYGQVAQVRPEWWSDEIRKLHLAASHPHPEVRTAVVQALHQLLLSSQNQRASQALQDWLNDKNPLVIAVARDSLHMK